MYPPTPSSQCSRMSRSSTFSKNYGHSTGWTIFFFSWILFPIRFLLGVPIRFFRLFYIRRSTASPRGSHQNSPLHAVKKIHSLRDHVIHRTTDRRRGVIEVFVWGLICQLTFILLFSLPLVSINVHDLQFSL